MPILQGSNSPIVVTFDRDISELPAIVITLWTNNGDLIKKWETGDLEIHGVSAVCPVTEEETAKFPGNKALTLEAKGLDEDGYVIFWSEDRVLVGARFDRNIYMTQIPQSG